MIALPTMQPTATAAVLTVNDDSSVNSYVPFHFYYLDNPACKTQVIYPASQLSDMIDSDIREIQFYLSESGFQNSWRTDDMIVSIGEHSNATFADDADAVFLTIPFTVAYSGPMSGEGGDRLLTFKLSTPYHYTGSNLVIQLSQGNASMQYPRAEFLGVNTDDNNAVYTTNGSSTTFDHFLPKTTFTYGEQAQYEAIVDPVSLTFPLTLTGQSSQSVVKVTNTGLQTLNAELSAISSPAFTATAPTGAIATGETIEIPVTFSPVAAGDFTGDFSINLGEAGTFKVELSGTGMAAPTGAVTTFDVASRTLPEGWIGWLVTDEYDFDVYEYKYKESKESTDYFEAYTKDGIVSLAIEEGNPIREYPNQHSAYMISPAVSGDVLLKLASTASTASLSSALIYEATPSSDGTWTISENSLDFNMAAPLGTGWGFMIGNVDKSTHLAIRLSYMAIAQFAAENAGGETAEYAACVSPEAIDFGTMLIGSTTTGIIKIRNTGTKEISLSVTGDFSSPFTVNPTATSIQPGKEEAVDVVFVPTTEGDYTATILLEMGAAGSKTVTVTAKAVTAQIGSEFEVDGLTYIILSTDEVGVSDVSSELTECVIPASVSNSDGVTFDVVSVERDAFYWSYVTKVVLPEGLRSIGYGAFRSSPLAEINLPSSLTSIGDYAFRTTEITDIVIPDGVTAIGQSVFGLCEQLRSVSLPSGLTSIGSGAFYKAAISSIDIPSTCTTIETEAFEACKNLTTVNLPEGLTQIASMLFCDCDNLKEVVIPSTVTDINTRAFENTSLTTLNIPASTTRIASSSFNNAPVATITVAEGNTSFKVIDGVLYSADGGFLYLYPRTFNQARYTVSDGCRGIVGGAFYGCKASEIELPQSMIGIDEYVFCLSDLRSINLPDGIVLIGTQAFAGTDITEMVLPSKLEEVANALFAGCTELKSVTLPATINLIGNRAFYNCSLLSEINAQGETPAEFDSWDGQSAPFLNVDCDKITVYCPDDTDVLTAYKNSEWADFFKSIKNISERPGAGIDNVESSDITISGGNAINVQLGDTVADIAVYTVDGRLVSIYSNATGTMSVNEVPAGIYVVMIRNFTFNHTAKVAVN